MIVGPSISEAARLALERQFEGKNRGLMVNTSSLQSRRSGSDLVGKPSQRDESIYFSKQSQIKLLLMYCREMSGPENF